LLRSRSPRSCSAAGTSSSPKESKHLDSRIPLPVAKKSSSWWSDRPWLGDAIVLLIFEIALFANVFVGEEPRWTILAHQTIILPLLARRRYPFQVLAVICVLGVIFAIFGGRVDALLSVMVAVYSVAVSRDRNGAMLAFAAAEVFVVASSLTDNSIGEIIASLFFQTGLVLAALFLGTTLQARRLYLQSLEERAIRLEQERDQQAELAASRERTRIAREMHDIVAHSLSVMITMADGAVATVQRDPEVAGAAMEQVASTGRQALGEMRNLLGVLRSDEAASLAPQPGLTRLETLFDEVRTAGLPVSVTIAGEPRAMSSTQETTVYRFVQEGLTNVLKHARYPSRAWVTLEWDAGALRLEVRDDGIVPTDPSNRDGLGLRGMQERLSIFGGEMSAGPVQPRGWVTRGVLPLEPESA
jgi:signal transduction histidine kinase